jgi:hypothetical protein
LDDCAAIDATAGAIDQIANTCRLQENGFLPRRGPMLPLLDQVTFSSAESLQLALARFAREDSARHDIARAQRQAVESRYGYAAGMRRVVQFIAARLQAETIAGNRAA